MEPTQVEVYRFLVNLRNSMWGDGTIRDAKNTLLEWMKSFTLPSEEELRDGQ